MLIEDSNNKFDPETVGVDFEQGLINATQFCFPHAKLVGCLFHWKQAIRRKMLALNIPKEVVEWYMRPGNLDLLTVLPKDDIKSINSKGVLWVAKECESGCGARPIVMEDKSTVPVNEWIASVEGREKMTDFWKYFER